MKRFIRKLIRSTLARFGYTLVYSSGAAATQTKKKVDEQSSATGPVATAHEFSGITKFEPKEIKSFYEANGYYVFRNALPRSRIQSISDIVAKEITGSNQPMLRHPSNAYEPHRYASDEDTGRKLILNALSDPHRQAETVSLGSAILDLVCTPEVANRLTAIDGAGRYTIHQTILFFAPPLTDLHLDGWGLDTDPPGGAYTLWIPLESVDLRNGPICVSPCRPKEFLTPDQLGIDSMPVTEDGNRSAYWIYHNAIVKRIYEQGASFILPQFSAGDFIVFSSLTPHATLPSHGNGRSRMAIQVLVRPSASRWAAFLPRTRGEVMDGDPRVSKISDQWHVAI
jgi:Phytanoyl-CoA dioxygenase (PhyH)